MIDLTDSSVSDLLELHGDLLAEGPNPRTVDVRPVPESMCKTILADIHTCAEKFSTAAILIDSDGVTRIGIACRWMKAKERSVR